MGKTTLFGAKDVIARGDMVSICPTPAVESPAGQQKGWGELKLDVTSEDAARQSLLRYVGVDELAEERDEQTSPQGIATPAGTGIGWGTVVSVNDTASTAVVCLWKRGTTLFSGSEGRPKEAYALSRLTKVPPVTFWRHCRKSFMAESGQYLKLRGGGHDESVPLSLVAYNNNIVNQLLEKTETKAVQRNPARLAGRRIVGGQRARLEALKQHSPVMRDAADPFGEVRDQLKALASMGIRSKATKGRMSARQRTAQRTLLATADGEPKAAAGEGDAPGTRIDGSLPTALHPSAMGRAIAAQQASMMQALNSSFAERKRALVSSLSEAHSLVLPRGWHEGTVSGVLPGPLLSLSLHGTAPRRVSRPAKVRLANITIPDADSGTSGGAQAFALLQRVCAGDPAASAHVLGTDPDGTPLAEVWVAGTSLQSLLVGRGFAQVAEWSDAGGDGGVGGDGGPAGGGGVPHGRDLWAQRQEAFQARLGMWKDDKAKEWGSPSPQATGMGDSVGSAEQREGGAGGGGGGGGGGAPTPALFDAFFSSPEYLALTKSNPALLSH